MTFQEKHSRWTRVVFFFKTWYNFIVSISKEIAWTTFLTLFFIGFITMTGQILWQLIFVPTLCGLVLTAYLAYVYTSDEFAESSIIQDGPTVHVQKSE